MSETEPLLNHEPPANDMKGSFWRRKLLSNVDPNRGDIVLLAACFVTGLLDCAIFNNYGVFVGMQTGNTVILCLSTTGHPTDNPYIWATTLVSLSSFFVGCFVTAHVATACGGLRRVVITSQLLVQALLIVLVAILVTLGRIPTDNQKRNPNVLGDTGIIAALPALAFQAGSTMATSRMMGYGQEIPVNVLTSTYAALATDSRLFAKDNPARNRRVIAVLCLVSGALCAAWLQHRGPGIKAVLYFGAAIKFALAGVVLLLLPAAQTSD